MKIVITGGPCAGKTTCLNALQSRLANSGVSCVTLFETPTIISNMGFPIADPKNKEAVQEIIFDFQMAMEEICFKNSFNQKVFILDRGLMDQKHYCGDELWKSILAKSNLTEPSILSRYDAVFKLDTLALSDENLYSLVSNPARYETKEMAIIADQQCENDWSGHHNLNKISWALTIDEKVEKIFSWILKNLSQ